MIVIYLLLIVFIVSVIALAVYALIKQIHTIITAPKQFYESAAMQSKLPIEEVRNRFTKIIKTAEVNCLREGVKIHITPTSNVEKGKLHVSTTFNFLKHINCSAVWIELIITNPSIWEVAFAQTIGHEYGHRSDIKRDYPLFAFRKFNDRRFFYWTREIRNDFWGIRFAEKYYGYTKDEILLAIDKKAMKYTENTKDKHHYKHPSWKFRQLCLMHKTLSGDVITQIANEAGCTNQNYISKVTTTTLKSIL